MEYTREKLNRQTGQLKTVVLGNYLTVTELGESYGVGPKKVRTVLHHLGLLHREGCKYRLPRWAVHKGLGVRHDKPRSGYAFDVISPLGQMLIADAWAEAVTELDEELAKASELAAARDALAKFKTARRKPMTTQEEVCWLSQCYEHLTFRQMATVLSVTEQLVGRYANRRAEQLGFHRRNVSRVLPRLSADERRANWLEGLRKEWERREAPPTPDKLSRGNARLAQCAAEGSTSAPSAQAAAS